MTSKLLATVWLFINLVVVVHAQKTFDLPVVLPPFSVKDGIKPSDSKPAWGSCLFYMENLGITVFQGKDKSPTAWAGVISAQPQKDQAKPHTFEWSDDFVTCPQNQTSSSDKAFTPASFVLKVHISTSQSVPAKQKDKTLFALEGKYPFTLKFETVAGRGWKLVDVVTDGFTVKGGDWLNGNLNVKAGSASNTTVSKMDVGTYNSYNYGCSATKVAIFDTDNKDIKVGVFFGNVQFQAFNYQTSTDKSKVHFSPNTHDCVGTFTHGSFMGIIVALVLATVLVFGFLMLNSVQTVDRFDDPKQKQLIINAKE